VIFLLLSLLTVQQAAPPLSVRGEISGAEFHITLAWNGPVEFTTASDTRELTVRFDRTVGAPVLEPLAQQFPQWIEGATSGFDSLLFRSAQEVTYTAEKSGNDVLVRLTPRGTAPISEAADRRADFRLDILRAQLLSDSGDDKPALELLDRLATEYPTETQVFMIKGGIHLRRNRWRNAKEAYKHVLTLDPAHDDAADAIKNVIIETQRSTFRADFAHRIVRNAQFESIYQVSGHLLFRDAFRLGYAAGHTQLHFNGARTDAYRGELYSQYDFRNGVLLRGGFLAGERTRGGTFQMDVAGGNGVLHVQADYQRPFWEFVEGILDDGTRDRIEVRRQQDIMPGFAVRGAVAANRYGLGARKNSATSLVYEGGVVKTFGRTNIFGFEYLFDAEQRQTHMNPALPLVSREVHGADAFFNVDLSRKLRMEGYGGYTVDRKGGEGPFYGGRLGFHVRGFEIQGAYDRRLNSVATGQVVTRYDAYLLWRF
jgi:hypothetical protein